MANFEHRKKVRYARPAHETITVLVLVLTIIQFGLYYVLIECPLGKL